MTVSSAPVGPVSTDKVSGLAATVFRCEGYRRFMALSVRTHFLRPSLCVDIYVKQSLQPWEKSVAEGELTSPIQIHVCFLGREGAVDVEFCTCAGRIRHTFPRSIAEHHPTDLPTKRNSTPLPPRHWSPSMRPKWTTAWHNFDPLHFAPCFASRYFSSTSHRLVKKKKLSAATDPTTSLRTEVKGSPVLTSSRRKAWCCLRVSLGGFWRKKMLHATGNHSAFFSATGCSSVPGWRQLRTLCKTRLV